MVKVPGSGEAVGLAIYLPSNLVRSNPILTDMMQASGHAWQYPVATQIFSICNKSIVLPALQVSSITSFLKNADQHPHEMMAMGNLYFLVSWHFRIWQDKAFTMLLTCWYGHKGIVRENLLILKKLHLASQHPVATQIFSICNKSIVLCLPMYCLQCQYRSIVHFLQMYCLLCYYLSIIQHCKFTALSFLYHGISELGGTRL